jgi:hypothetical protein
MRQIRRHAALALPNRSWQSLVQAAYAGEHTGSNTFVLGPESPVVDVDSAVVVRGSCVGMFASDAPAPAANSVNMTIEISFLMMVLVVLDVNGSRDARIRAP